MGLCECIWVWFGLWDEVYVYWLVFLVFFVCVVGGDGGVVILVWVYVYLGDVVFFEWLLGG